MGSRGLAFLFGFIEILFGRTKGAGLVCSGSIGFDGGY